MSDHPLGDTLGELFAAFGVGGDVLQDALHRTFAADGCWENPGVPTARGPQEAYALTEQWRQSFGLVRVDFVVHRSLEGAGIVMNERTDYGYDGDGKQLFELDLAGVFRFESGRITAWRDYPFR